ncbi:hypothetical protein O3M35_012736 [Rhynocoris fuscipes]|uniref:Transcription initiation factor TFIID subunit 13 n=1 Tax=Rhynocoris fuscipes TaxID=488301 RepID=A0AAW1D0R1_9HEMI
MMYGFGDDANPYKESIHLLEDLVIYYITQMTIRALQIGRQGEINIEDLLFLVRNDERKLHKIKYLIKMQRKFKKIFRKYDFGEFSI